VRRALRRTVGAFAHLKIRQRYAPLMFSGVEPQIIVTCFFGADPNKQIIGLNSMTPAYHPDHIRDVSNAV
jgi:hypothetical protein